MKEHGIDIFPISCNKDCGAGCALSAHIQDGRLIKVTDSKHRTEFMQGCVKGYRMPDILYHPDRLTSPMRRVGKRGSDEFVPISWEEAYDTITEKLRSVEPRQVMRTGGSGSCRGVLHNTATLTKRFLSLYGEYTDTAGNYSSEVVEFINPYIFGTKTVGIDISTILQSKAVILWGFNPFDTRFGCETEQVFREVKRRGIPCFVIDPRRTKSVSLCGGEWIGINAGTDSHLASALCYLALQRFPERLQELDRFSVGHHEIAKFINGMVDGTAKDPAYAAGICGIPEETINRLFDALIDNPAAVLPGLSVQRVLGGENTQRLLIFLQLLCGNAGLIGGSIGGGQWNAVPRVRVGSIGCGTTPNSVPVNKWADAVVQGRSGGYPSDIKVIYNVGGNFINQSSDTAKVKQAHEAVELIITHEMFMTPTALHSDIVLPVTMFCEREDFCSANTGQLFYSKQVVDAPENVKDDYEIFSDLAERLGFGESFTEGKSPSQWLDEFLSGSEIDDTELFRERGFWNSDQKPFTAFTDFFKDPEAYPMGTPSGKIELVSEDYEAIGGDHYPLLPEDHTNEDYPLRMVTPHPRFRIHSQNVNIETLQRMQDDTVWMHPEDAMERGITDGEEIRISSDRGYTFGIVSIDDHIVRGTVSKCQGYWYRAGELGDCNYLTSDESTTPGRGSRTHTIAVQVVRKAQG